VYALSAGVSSAPGAAARGLRWRKAEHSPAVAATGDCTLYFATNKSIFFFV